MRGAGEEGGTGMTEDNIGLTTQSTTALTVSSVMVLRSTLTLSSTLHLGRLEAAREEVSRNSTTCRMAPMVEERERRV